MDFYLLRSAPEAIRFVRSYSTSSRSNASPQDVQYDQQAAMFFSSPGEPHKLHGTGSSTFVILFPVQEICPIRADLSDYRHTF